MSVKETATLWWSPIEMTGRKSTCCTGSLPVQAIILWRNGNGFTGSGDIPEITVLYFSRINVRLEKTYVFECGGEERCSYLTENTTLMMMTSMQY